MRGQTADLDLVASVLHNPAFLHAGRDADQTDRYVELHFLAFANREEIDVQHFRPVRVHLDFTDQHA